MTYMTLCCHTSWRWGQHSSWSNAGPAHLAAFCLGVLGAGLIAFPEDAAPNIHVCRGCVLVCQAQRGLEGLDPLGFITPAGQLGLLGSRASM